MSDSPAVAFEDGIARTTLDLRVYRLTAVKRAAYRLAERFTAALGAPDGHRLPVSFLFKPGTAEATARESVRAFFQEMLDQELREQIAEETGPMRTLILAHAFSKTDLIRRE
jgi:His-Xaa-Ser system protein HxsD